MSNCVMVDDSIRPIILSVSGTGILRMLILIVRIRHFMDIVLTIVYEMVTILVTFNIRDSYVYISFRIVTFRFVSFTLLSLIFQRHRSTL